MKTILQSGYGDPEQVLAPAEVETPTPGEGEVLVRVHATSVNTPDWIATRGVPYVLRLTVGLRGPRSPVRGSDVAGVVVTVGAGVTGFPPGDAVFGSVWTGRFERGAPGTFSEYTVVPAAQLAHMPSGLGFDEAAGAVMSGVTALLALRDVARVQPGQKVLINGASGGLGTFAVQIARELGAEVTGVCSTRNLELVRSLGAHHVIDYTTTSYPTQDARYDVIMDNVMNHPASESARALTPEGVLLMNSIGTHRWLGTLPGMVFAALFKSRQRRTVQFVPSRENLEAIAAMLKSGAVRVVIDQTYPLADAGKAVAHMVSRRARGKVVIHVE
jgi:NADPH:quinone reductase-like Zn-dependent oxidoreductase